jgi:cell division protein FtsX|tara:strand:- start:137 stop:331 length:195 start_codon:yes stop_codon:yes gene_type:complete
MLDRNTEMKIATACVTLILLGVLMVTLLGCSSSTRVKTRLYKEEVQTQKTEFVPFPVYDITKIA